MLSNIEFFKQKATENPKLSKAEQDRLFILWRDKGDVRARDHLLFSTYGMCIREAQKKLTDYMIEFEELLAIAILAQAHALHKYDPNQKCSFSTYLHTWLRSYYIDAIKASRVVKIPNYVPLAKSVQRVSMVREDFDLDFAEEDKEAMFSLDVKASNVFKYRIAKNSKKKLTKPDTTLSLFAQ